MLRSNMSLHLKEYAALLDSSELQPKTTNELKMYCNNVIDQIREDEALAINQMPDHISTKARQKKPDRSINKKAGKNTKPKAVVKKGKRFVSRLGRNAIISKLTVNQLLYSDGGKSLFTQMSADRTYDTEKKRMAAKKKMMTFIENAPIIQKELLINWIKENLMLYQVTVQAGSSCTVAALTNAACLLGLEKEYFGQFNHILTTRQGLTALYTGETDHNCVDGFTERVNLVKGRGDHEPPIQNWEAYLYGMAWCYNQKQHTPIYSLNETKSMLAGVVKSFSDLIDVYDVKYIDNTLPPDPRLFKKGSDEMINSFYNPRSAESEQYTFKVMKEALSQDESVVYPFDVACNAAEIIEGQLDQGKPVPAGFPEHAVCIIGYDRGKNELYALGSYFDFSRTYEKEGFSYTAGIHVIPRDWGYYYMTSFAVMQEPPSFIRTQSLSTRFLNFHM